MQLTPDPSRPGISTCRLPRGELRAQTRDLAELEALGLLDLEAWSQGRLRGETLHQRAERRVVRMRAGDRELYAKHQRGRRAGEWLLELVHLRRPLSAAGREERAVRALERLGVRAPRVLLAGELRGALGVELESFLVTEQLPGEPLEEQELDEGLRTALAELAATLSRARVGVPDLYAKHLWVSRDAQGRPRLGLLDLPRVEPRSRRGPARLFVRHAAGLLATVPGLELERLVQHAPEGVRGARLAHRIQERAELVRRRKKLPVDYGARHRYGAAEQVEAYRARSSSRHQRELRMLEALLPTRIEGVVVDAPCGGGRFSALLEERGARALALDLSGAMARSARASVSWTGLGEVERLPLADASVEGALCFRFLHHVPTAGQRRRVLAELTRVSRAFVVLSFFHPLSAHHALRRTRAALGLGRSSRFPVSLRRLSRELTELGWKVDAVRAEARYRRDLWVLRAVPR